MPLVTLVNDDLFEAPVIPTRYIHMPSLPRNPTRPDDTATDALADYATAHGRRDTTSEKWKDIPVRGEGDDMLKYEAIARDIQGKIERGEYQPNDRLPVMSELCEQYDVSKITIKRAMDILVSHGLVIKRRGSGSYVKDIAVEQLNVPFQDMSKQLAGFTGEYEGSDIKVTSEVNDFSVITPSDEVVEQMRVKPTDFVYYICRTRLADGVPQVIEYNYMPISVVPGLTLEHVNSSVYSYIEQDLGLKIYSAHRSIKAVMPTKKERQWLQAGPNTPLLEVKQVSYLADGRIFEYSTMRHVGDKYVFYTISTR